VLVNKYDPEETHCVVKPTCKKLMQWLKHQVSYQSWKKMYSQSNLTILNIYVALNVSLLLWGRKLPLPLPIFLTFIPS